MGGIPSLIDQFGPLSIYKMQSYQHHVTCAHEHAVAGYPYVHTRSQHAHEQGQGQEHKKQKQAQESKFDHTPKDPRAAGSLHIPLPSTATINYIQGKEAIEI